MPHTVFDLRTWEDFEEKLKELLEEVPVPQPGVPDRPVLYRGQENSCWTATTTLERGLDGQETSFLRYYESIYRAKSEIESYSERAASERWDVPPPERLEHLLTRGDLEPFASRNREDFKTWGQVGSYMVYLRHHGFPSPFLDWTRSPYIAAFFAFRHPIKGVGKVSIFVIPKLVHFQVKSPGQPEIYILPRQYSPMPQRHFLQQAEYTYCVQNAEVERSHGVRKGEVVENSEREWRFELHEGAFGRDGHNVIWKFNLPTTERLKVLRLLNRFNLNAFSLFGSEESLMETMAFRELGQ